MASVVADLHDITKDQVNVWVRKKASIYEHAGTDKRDKKRHHSRKRHKKGTFSLEEETVFMSSLAGDYLSVSYFYF